MQELGSRLTGAVTLIKFIPIVTLEQSGSLTTAFAPVRDLKFCFVMAGLGSSDCACDQKQSFTRI